MQRALVLAGLLLGGAALAQESASFKLNEHAFNAGGTPAQGVELTSASFSITLASIGDGMVARGLSSSSFELDAGFDMAYPPPGEVAATCGAPGSCLLFTDVQTLTWPPEPSAGVYNLYRDLASNLMGFGFGQCEQQDLNGTTTTDNDPVPSGDGFFYLLTVENRLAEEGTKGFSVESVTMIERGGAVCP